MNTPVRIVIAAMVGIVALAAFSLLLPDLRGQGNKTASKTSAPSDQIATHSEDANNPPSVPAPKPKVALIYNGQFADRQSAQRISTLALQSGFEPVYFSDLKQLEEHIDDAGLLAFGGTVDDIGPLINSFTPESISAIRHFIQEGGRYLGICGGAYLASAGWQEEGGFTRALGLAPLTTANFASDALPRIMTVNWKGTPRSVYYQLGPNFTLPESEDAHVLARYSDHSIAALMLKSGRGTIYLVGPHPEAEETWLEEDMEGLSNWSNTDDLARDMMQDVTGF